MSDYRIFAVYQEQEIGEAAYIRNHPDIKGSRAHCQTSILFHGDVENPRQLMEAGQVDLVIFNSEDKECGYDVQKKTNMPTFILHNIRLSGEAIWSSFGAFNKVIGNFGYRQTCSQCADFILSILDLPRQYYPILPKEIRGSPDYYSNIVINYLQTQLLILGRQLVGSPSNEMLGKSIQYIFSSYLQQMTEQGVIDKWNINTNDFPKNNYITINVRLLSIKTKSFNIYFN